MKNLFLSAIAVALSFGAFAQNTNPTKTTEPTEQAQPAQQKDVYVFKNSKMWEVKSGKISEMAKDVTLASGTTVKTTGEVVTKDGEKVALKDGQYIDLDGKIGETTQG
ncbi:MAG TPA: DUF6799 domain-containing protein [Hanamia sp.]|nr:DUF6799 domain-containing protein [Hanamia sp.]